MICPHCGSGDRIRNHCPRVCGWMECHNCKAVILSAERHYHPLDQDGLCAGKKDRT